MLKIQIDNFGDIKVTHDSRTILVVKRKVTFFDKVYCDYYADEKLILKTTSHQVLPIRTKIEFQDLASKISTKTSLNPWKSCFEIDNDLIAIIDNPFYLSNKKFSKILENDQVVGKVSLINRLGASSKKYSTIELELKITQDFKPERKFLLMLCYVMSCAVLSSG